MTIYIHLKVSEEKELVDRNDIKILIKIGFLQNEYWMGCHKLQTQKRFCIKMSRRVFE